MPRSYLSLRLHFVSLAVYTLLAFLAVSSVLPNLASAYIGNGQDPILTMWFLKWIPYALMHRLNPLVTDYIFSYSGINLTWNTAVPLIGIIMSPVTWTGGLMFSYNIALILGLIGSAWTAYFVASRFGCRFLAALLAGGVYGFSPFTMAHALGHLHLVVAFAPPLFLLLLRDALVAQRQAPWIGGIKLAGLVVAQYLISTEVLLTVALLSLFAICAICISCARTLTRQQLMHAAQALLFSLLLTLPLLSVFLYFQFIGPWRPAQPIHSPSRYVADLLSFILPTSIQGMSIGASRIITSHFSGNLEEWNTYLGIPLIILLTHIFYIRREDRTVKFLFAFLLGAAVLSMGPFLHLGGNVTGILLPWRLFEHMPIVQNIQTTRFGEYIYLLAGLLLAIYISQESISLARRIGRFAVSLAAVVFLMPTVPFPITYPKVPEFFRSPGIARDIESPALVLPFATAGCTTSMLWQAQSGFAFQMPEGFAIGPEAEDKNYGPKPTPLSRALLEIQDSGHLPAITSALHAEIIGVLKRHQIKTILLGPSQHEGELLTFLTRSLGWPPESKGGVLVWRHVDRHISSEFGTMARVDSRSDGTVGWHPCL